LPLAVNRQYVIKHEVGHDLGHHHAGCLSAVPVMVQQTLKPVRVCRTLARAAMIRYSPARRSETAVVVRAGLAKLL
jgi:hypothetical protein